MAAARIEQLVAKSGSIAVFSKSYCPYCVRAKGILSSYSGVSSRMTVLELDHMGKEGQTIQDQLAQRLGKSHVTVPQVFINGKLIGGCSDVEAAWANGSLEDLIAELNKMPAT